MGHPLVCTFLTDEQWEWIEPHLKVEAKRTGRPRRDAREVFEAVLFMLHTGIQWKHLSAGFPPKSTVHDCLKLWCVEERFRILLVSLIGRLLKTGRLELDMGFIDATFASAKGGGEGVGLTRKGTKIQLAVDAQGIPLGVSLAGADSGEPQVGRLHGVYERGDLPGKAGWRKGLGLRCARHHAGGFRHRDDRPAPPQPEAGEPDAGRKEAQGLQEALGRGADDGVAAEPQEAAGEARETPLTIHGFHPAGLLHDRAEENPVVLVVDENRVFGQLLEWPPKLTPRLHDEADIIDL